MDDFKKKKKKKDEDAFSFSANTENKRYFFCFFANKGKGDKLTSQQNYMYKSYDFLSYDHLLDQLQMILLVLVLWTNQIHHL